MVADIDLSEDLFPSLFLEGVLRCSSSPECVKRKKRKKNRDKEEEEEDDEEEYNRKENNK